MWSRFDWRMFVGLKYGHRIMLSTIARPAEHGWGGTVLAASELFNRKERVTMYFPMFSLIFHGYQSEPPNCLTFRHPCYCSNGFHLFGQAKWSQGTLLSRPRAYGTNYMAKNPLRWLWGKWKLSVNFFECIYNVHCTYICAIDDFFTVL